MNGALPGLLDDPQLSLTDLPTLADFHIAPIRNPAPLRSGNAPSPLEPWTKNAVRKRPENTLGQDQDDEGELHRNSLSVITPNDVLSTRETKKPTIAISELLDGSADNNVPTQLPSFVSLSVVEKSPIQQPFRLEVDHPHKRPRFDVDSENAAYDLNRLLPRPAQKDGKPTRPVPLLPAMVTGLHEPPPSAALLPSMDLETRPEPTRSTPNTKIQVKDILEEPRQISHGRPPELMVNTPTVPAAELPKVVEDAVENSVEDPTSHNMPLNLLESLKKDSKTRRMRRKWSEKETSDLIAGVKKHGFGKWKQILDDPEYQFAERTSIDLKDRFRVFAKDYPDLQLRQGKAETVETLQFSKSIGSITEISSEALFDKTASSLIAGIAAKPRRKRHPWTKEEDAALLRGVNKHGFQWTDIHNDPDLELVHRRATDLRDRIRNLYPEGYKQAEARPLRSELRKAGKTGSMDSGTTSEPQNHHDLHNAGDLDLATSEGVVQKSSRSQGVKTPAKKAHSIAALTSSESQSDRVATKRTKPVTADTTAIEHGVTLPSLDLDEGHQLDWGDNTLAPFLGWDDNLGL